MSKMQTPGKKVQMKDLDIRTAFLGFGQRKRKLSDTENGNTPKTAKLTSDEVTENNKKNKTVLASPKSLDLPSSSSGTNGNGSVQPDQKPESSTIELVDLSDCDSEEGDVTNSSSLLDTSMASSGNAELPSISTPTSHNASSPMSDLSLNSDAEPAELLPNEEPTVADDVPTVTPKRKRTKMTPEQAQVKEAQRAEKLKEKEERQKLKEQKSEERQIKMEELQRAKEQQMRIKERQKRMRELEKREKEEQKKEKELQRQEEKRLKQEMKEQEEQRKQKEKEQKDKIKQMQLKWKQEKERQKEEQKLKALEERARLEEEKKADEEKKKLHTEKERNAFKNFFLKSGFTLSASQVEQNQDFFRPFQVKEGMVLAKIVPVAAKERFHQQNLENQISSQNCGKLYLDQLKSGTYKSIHQQKTKLIPVNDDDIIIVDKALESNLNVKAKLLQFCENIRPAYWGTWRKKSKTVKPRQPFSQDAALDYEVDSEEEWDEGGPGESLTGTEDEESEDDYEVDNEFFVPHGYLSAEEEGEDEEAPTDPEILKTRLKMKEREFLSERKKKMIELKPIIFGCFYEGKDEMDLAAAEKFLKPYSAELLTSLEIPTSAKVMLNNESCGTEAADKSSPAVDRNHQKTGNKQVVPEEAIPYLIKLLHANTNSKSFVIREFQEFWMLHCLKSRNSISDTELKENQTPLNPVPLSDSVNSPKTDTPTMNSLRRGKISKRQLNKTISSISSWCKSPNVAFGGFCWWVNDEVLIKYASQDIPVPNEWVYVHSKQNT